jgi:hypothetical protein
VYSQLSTAVEALIQFVSDHSLSPMGLTSQSQGELEELDLQVYSLSRAANIAIPEVLYYPSSPYKPYLNTKIPYYQGHKGLHVSAEKNWLQAMRGLKQTTEILRDSAASLGARVVEGSTTDERNGWLTVTAAADFAFVDRGVVSRAANDDKLRTNGLKGPERRICAIDLCRWTKERLRKREREC